MRKTILAQTLNTLQKGEWKRWSAFIQSPYHVSHEGTQALGIYLAKHLPQGDDTALLKTTIWQQLFPEKPYKELIFNNYVSDLLEATHQFFAVEQLRGRDALRYDLTAHELVARGLYKSAKRTVKKWTDTAANSPTVSADTLLLDSRRAHFDDTLHLLGGQRRYAIALQEKSNRLDQYYVLQQLVNYCEMINRGNIVQGQYQTTYLPDILARYERNDLQLQALPPVAVYYHLCQLLLGNDPDHHYPTLEQLLMHHTDALTAEEKRAVYDYLLNFCVQQINQGQTRYYERIFTIYQQLIAQSLLLREGKLTQWTYTNIITTGSRLLQWEWTETFAEHYADYLPPEDRHNAYHYNVAALRYEQQDYPAALQGLNKVEFTDAFYQLAAKTIQLKTYYQLQESEAFNALLATTRQYVLRNRQLSLQKKKAYQQFLKFLRQLYALRQQKPLLKASQWAKQHQLLHAQLSGIQTPINHKGWLMEEVSKLAH